MGKEEKVYIVKISIVIPAKDEASRIQKPLDDCLQTFGKESELIVVSNGSEDETCEIVSRYKEEYPDRLKLLRFSKALGKGGALREGFKIAEGDIIGFTDADGSYRAEDAKKLCGLIKRGSDVVIGSKWRKRHILSVNESFLKKISSRLWNFFVRIFFGIHIEDTQAGLKFFRREVIEEIFDDLKTKGFEFDVEILWRAKNNGFKIKEKYTYNKDLEGSSFKLRYGLGMFFSLFKIRLKEL